MQYGARHLKRAIDRYLTCPLASLLATEQVCMGDVISIDWDGKENGLRFLKEKTRALLSVDAKAPESMAQAAVASSGSLEVSLPVLKTKATENAAPDGNGGPSPQGQTNRHVNADRLKPRTQVRRARTLAHPH